MGSKQRQSTSEIAILGVLSLHESLSGYDIREFIGASISHFWNESFGQIYPILARLKRQKLVTVVVDKDSSRDRKLYSITEDGRQKVSQWIAEKAQPDRPRSELLLKVFLGSQVHPDVVIEHLESLAESCAAQAAIFQQIEREVRRLDSGKRTLPYSIVSIRAGLRLAQARAKWAREAIVIIRKGAE